MSRACFWWCPCYWNSSRRSKKAGLDTLKHFSPDPRRRHDASLLSRVPLWSGLAFLMCTCASIVLGACFHNAVNYIVTLLDFTIVQTAMWVVMVFHVLISSYFLLIGILSTGRTQEELMATSSCANHLGRCVQAGCICTAYILHLLWLFLPALLIIPLALLAAVNVMCNVVPDCITLSDYGINPELIDRYGPEVLMGHVRRFNESLILSYTDRAESLLLKTIDDVEKSSLLEQFMRQIEAHIPDDHEAERFVSDLLENIDLGQLTQLLEEAEGGIGHIDNLVAMLGNLPNTTEYIQILTESRPDLVDLANEHLPRLTQEVEKGTKHSDAWINKSVSKTRGTFSNAQGTKNDTVEDIVETLKNTSSRIDPVTIQLSQTPAYLEIPVENGTVRTDAEMFSVGMNDTVVLPDVVANAVNSTMPQSRLTETVVEQTVDVIQDTVEQSQGAIGDELDSVKHHVEGKVGEIHQRADGVHREVVDRVEGIVTDVQDTSEKALSEMVNQARKLAKEAEEVARMAAEEAELALTRAEELAKAAAQEVDVTAKQAAQEASDIAKEAAKVAQKAAADAIRRAQAALDEAEDVAKAAARGAVGWARQAMKRLRQYVSRAFQWARTAIEKGKKAAKLAVQYLGKAKVQLLNIYEHAKRFYNKLLIRRVGADTFCFDGKVLFCSQIEKSLLYWAVVFLSSIVINLSMVHFLMAMSANYVYQQVARRSPLNNVPSEGPMFTTLDSGSLTLVSAEF